MQTMQANLKARQETDRQNSDEMARVKQALDSASAPVIVTDEHLTITYQNLAADRFFTRLESDLRQVMSRFCASELIGSNLENLLSNQKLSADAIRNLTDSVEQDLLFGDITLGQVISPIIDEQGTIIGTVVEWQDRTEQLSVEDEIQCVVNAALAGDLSQRLNLEDKQGFFLLLSDRMNDLVGICENVVNDTVRVFGAMSRYDLTESITGNYQGSFAQVKTKANLTLSQLTGMISDIQADATLLDTSTKALSGLNSQMYDTAETSSHQASNVSTAAEQISVNITGVATASTQTSASISEIARNASDATRIAEEAVSLAESTETTVRKLSDSSNDIGNVINSIAEQTDLLELNATIEAARAGDAGKGFAVVANEVKDLAKETAKATEEISGKIATIQTDSESAVEAIGGIDKTIQQINDIQAMIAAAVQEQTATTNEISRSVIEAADGSSHIAENSSKAAAGAMQALNSTSDAQQSTAKLSRLATELSTRMEQFKVRAAETCFSLFAFHSVAELSHLKQNSTYTNGKTLHGNLITLLQRSFLQCCRHPPTPWQRLQQNFTAGT